MTSDLKRRWGGDGRKYIRSETLIGEKIYEYGWENFQKEILYSDLTEEEGSKKEREMITLYHSTDPESGYNRQTGGMRGFQQPDDVLKIFEVQRQQKQRQVINLDTLEIFNSLCAAAEYYHTDHGSISRVCTGQSKQLHGMRFAFLKDYENNTIPVFQSKPMGKRIRCIETGEEYACAFQAAKILGVSSQAISHACTGKVQTCLGYHWEFINQSKDKTE